MISLILLSRLEEQGTCLAYVVNSQLRNSQLHNELPTLNCQNAQAKKERLLLQLLVSYLGSWGVEEFVGSCGVAELGVDASHSNGSAVCARIGNLNRPAPFELKSGSRPVRL